MSSSPLFISVAESTEILRPICQRGCAQACSGVAAGHLGTRRAQERPAGSREQHAPYALPAVRSRIAAGTGRSRCARCRSGSAVHRSNAPPRAAAARRRPVIPCSPASTRLPVEAAASVEPSPAAPTMAAITVSISAAARDRLERRIANAPPSSQRRQLADRLRVPAPPVRPRARQPGTMADALLEQPLVIAGRRERHDSEPVGMTLRDVERRYPDAAGGAEDSRDAGSQHESCAVQAEQEHRPCRRQAVDAIEHAAVPRQQAAAVLETRASLEHAFDEIADHRDQRDRETQQRPTSPTASRTAPRRRRR